MSNPASDTDYKIATSLGSLATLRSLGIPNPKPVWSPGVTTVTLGDNSKRVLGAPRLEWRWGFISQAARDALRSLCPGGSAAVYIVTPTTETVSTVPNASKRYSCQMWWPSPDNPEAPDAGRRLDFVITFRQLVEV
jgi:hypothetical protein